MTRMSADRPLGTHDALTLAGLARRDSYPPPSFLLKARIYRKLERLAIRS
jgi:hypothetical protein